MATFQETHRAARKTLRATEPVIITVGVLIAIGAAVLILSLTDVSTTQRAARSHPTPRHAPLAHFYGTGTPPASRTTQVATNSNSATTPPAGHFYGLQP